MTRLVLDHRPRPGPGYWDWRCLTCSEDVALHGSWLERWRWRREQRRLGS